MKLVDLTVTDFLSSVASNNATPGGGSVSALASSLGTSLSVMVGALTVNKKKFKTFDEEIQNTFNAYISQIQEQADSITKLIDKDTEAFNVIMDAFKLPKETEHEKEYRNLQILLGTKKAIEVPFALASKSLEILKLLPYISKYCNKNAISDLGVSSLLLTSGIEGAIMNVRINVPGLTDESEKEEYLAKVDTILKEAKELKQEVLTEVYKSI